MAENTTSPKPPAITHILETCLMVKDIRKSTDFYKTVLSVEPFLDNVSTPFSLRHQLTSPI
jgi:catechol 2,3-dioxygenase-like lactoylglutathione lyase family enzyme